MCKIEQLNRIMRRYGTMYLHLHCVQCNAEASKAVSSTVPVMASTVAAIARRASQSVFARIVQTVPESRSDVCPRSKGRERERDHIYFFFERKTEIWQLRANLPLLGHVCSCRTLVQLAESSCQVWLHCQVLRIAPRAWVTQEVPHERSRK